MGERKEKHDNQLSFLNSPVFFLESFLRSLFLWDYLRACIRPFSECSGLDQEGYLLLTAASITVGSQNPGFRNQMGIDSLFSHPRSECTQKI